MQRVLIVGVSGSGKSTLAEQVAARLGLPYIPTDLLYWGERWRRIPLAEVHMQAAKLAAEPRWVMDGNFDDAYETLWGEADTLVWLDYSRRVVAWWLVRRNLGWWLSGEPVWSDNPMTLKMALSGVRHGLRGYSEKQRVYPERLARFPAARVLRFREPEDAARWLRGLEPAPKKTA